MRAADAEYHQLQSPQGSTNCIGALGVSTGHVGKSHKEILSEKMQIAFMLRNLPSTWQDKVCEHLGRLTTCREVHDKVTSLAQSSSRYPMSDDIYIYIYIYIFFLFILYIYIYICIDMCMWIAAMSMLSTILRTLRTIAKKISRRSLAIIVLVAVVSATMQGSALPLLAKAVRGKMEVEKEDHNMVKELLLMHSLQDSRSSGR